MTLSRMVPEGVPALTLMWAPVPDALGYIVCQIDVPIGPDQLQALMAGSFDLMLTRVPVPAGVTRVREDRSARAHRLVLVRLPGDRVDAVKRLRLAAGAAPDAPSLASFGVTARHATAPAEPPPLPRPRRGRGAGRAVIDEPGGTVQRSATVIERPLTVAEGRQIAAARLAPVVPQSPLEAFESTVRPRTGLQRRPDMTTPPRPKTSRGEGLKTPRWVVICSPDLLMDAGKARGPLRKLRGYLHVAAAGSRLAHVQSRLDRIGVPLDRVMGLESNSDLIAEGLECPPGVIAAVALADEETPPGTRRFEATLADLSEVADRIIALVEG